MRALVLGASFFALCFGGAGASANSLQDDSFAGGARLCEVFLRQASELARTRSDNASLRAFAGREAAAAESVIDIIDARRSPNIASRDAQTTVASNDVVTGRSAFVENVGAATVGQASAGVSAMLPAVLVALDHLAASKGPAFDTLFKAAQIDASHQLASLYEAYGASGDDPALKQLAKSELTATNNRIAELTGF